MSKVIAEIIEVRGGNCSAGHKVGEKFIFTRERAPELCPWALGALLPAAMVLLNNGNFYWAKEGEPTQWGCPDPNTTVVFSLRREG
ncbi:MAG: hypothetical protein PWR22_1589 [Moorella sp. (in: firmicutes)]|jgi:uncharacterized repeat protein (TIGR04076 family)|uniref:TIGR04076 family protein n=1 Tax=unclassified Neomoorella TaxID=2676739 RepID=UPI0010FFB1CA|nr:MULTISPECIES: TIGR04076 family protein [unclassified Moorella (in: firmicutes)]MDK2816960.1 hypothetical protein [Moorella sp. (in: firmicutes)]GEA14722.1 hypothetical protein E308F_09640 [Moorella sp. E308F]GEA17904.1 hypothetical protein E306M_10380 [Moorella sp. E306M]